MSSTEQDQPLIHFMAHLMSDPGNLGAYMDLTKQQKLAVLRSFRLSDEARGAVVSEDLQLAIAIVKKEIETNFPPAKKAPKLVWPGDGVIIEHCHPEQVSGVGPHDITIHGYFFGNDKSKVEVTFDGVVAEIDSCVEGEHGISTCCARAAFPEVDSVSVKLATNIGVSILPCAIQRTE